VSAKSSKNGMRVLFVVEHTTTSPGTRYRVMQFLPWYEAAGLQCTVMPLQGPRSTRRSLMSPTLGRTHRLIHWITRWAETQVGLARIAGRFADYERIYLYRIPLPTWARRKLVPLRDRVLFDFDDALDVPDRGGGLAHLRHRFVRAGFRNALLSAGLVVASNRRNADALGTLHPNVTMVPTSVVVARYPFRERRRLQGGPAVFGWIGTPSTAGYLRLLEPALEALRRERRFIVRLVGAGANPLHARDIELREWRLETEVEEITRFDVGLMPMPDTEWTRGKAALKALQYGASGAPTVASWTLTNEELLGSSGGVFLCRSEDEWIESLRRLLDDDDLRAQMGARARARVTERFSVEANVRQLIGLIRDPHRSEVP